MTTGLLKHLRKNEAFIDTSLKEALDRIWNRGGVLHPNRVAKWIVENGRVLPNFKHMRFDRKRRK